MINDFQISKHFNLREFQNSSGEVKLNPLLVTNLEELRSDLGGVSIIITSGYRSPEDNNALADRLGWIEDGGLVSRDSQHIWGNAADIVCYDFGLHQYLSPLLVAKHAEPLFSFVKPYKAHTHVDVR